MKRSVKRDSGSLASVDGACEAHYAVPRPSEPRHVLASLNALLGNTAYQAHWRLDEYTSAWSSVLPSAGVATSFTDHRAHGAGAVISPILFLTPDATISPPGCYTATTQHTCASCMRLAVLRLVFWWLVGKAAVTFNSLTLVRHRLKLCSLQNQ